MAKPHDRPASEPGGCECMACGVIFIGEEWHTQCAVCIDPMPAEPPHLSRPAHQSPQGKRTTPAMLARLRELTNVDGLDDYDRCVLMLIDDFEELTARPFTEMPDDVRVPLHSLQADTKYLFGRVAADGSTASAMADSVISRLSQIETAVYRMMASRPAQRPAEDVAAILAELQNPKLPAVANEIYRNKAAATITALAEEAKLFEREIDQLRDLLANAEAERDALAARVMDVVQHCIEHDGDDTGWRQCAEYIAAKLAEARS